MDLQIAVSLARKEMSAATQSEFEYRRSVRQISLGIVPPVLIATAAAEVANAAGPGSAGSMVLLGALYLVVGVGFTFGLLSTAAYQENVGQSLLLDLAFLRYWELVQEERHPTYGASNGAAQ